MKPMGTQSSNTWQNTASCCTCLCEASTFEFITAPAAAIVMVLGIRAGLDERGDDVGLRELERSDGQVVRPTQLYI